MPIKKDYVGFDGQVSLLQAQHRVTRIELIMTGKVPSVYATAQVFASEEKSTDGAQPIGSGIGFVVGSTDDPRVDAFREFVDEQAALLPEFSGGVVVAESKG